jgi:hypothetical protein
VLRTGNPMGFFGETVGPEYRYVYGIPQVHIRAKVTRASNKGTLKDN